MSQDTDTLREALEDIRSILGPKPGFVGQQILAITNKALFAAPERRDEWQPIETAPRDGTRFLAYEDGNHYGLEWVPEMPTSGYWKACCGQYVTIPPEPTHWMPLPEPPALRTTTAPAEGGSER